MPLSISSPSSIDGAAEWLEADGLGGFACGRVDGVRTRRYHAVLQASIRPPTDRVTLVNGFDAWIETPSGTYPLTSQRYLPDLIHPDASAQFHGFDPEPWPTWRYRLPDGTEVVHELTVPKELPVALCSWRLAGPAEREGSVDLVIRPLLSCRDAHSLHLENPGFRFDAVEDGEMVRWHPYLGIPGVTALSNGRYSHDPVWYRGFLYADERDRGLDHCEDLASPGAFRWRLDEAPASLILTTDSSDMAVVGNAGDLLRRMREEERTRRAAFSCRLERAADAFIVRRAEGRTILAGYPWSTDWGRDTFVALRGLCLSTDRLDDALEILLGWSGHISRGMLPTHFMDRLREPEFASADTSLWYVIAVHEYLQAMMRQERTVSRVVGASLQRTVNAILTGYVAGGPHGVRVDADGLLACGDGTAPATWMDARLGEWLVTPRIGKPVEVQALWINALRIGAGFAARWQPLLDQASASFQERFWYSEGNYLFDVVDVDHTAGAVDTLFRPNQILAVGGLPFAVLDGERARRVVDAVEARLLTPLGLRSLAPGEPGYAGRYQGSARQRDLIAHQGSVWLWLLGPFVEAWVRVRGGTAEARREARTRFLPPLLRHLDEAGLGHASELADGDAPHTPRGSPFQAWSLGEAIRLIHTVLADPEPVRAPDAHAATPAGTRLDTVSTAPPIRMRR